MVELVLGKISVQLASQEVITEIFREFFAAAL